MRDWRKEFQYLLDRKILSRDELGYLFGQIKSIIDVETERHRWIPVSERLPEDGGLYLLTKDYDKGEDLWLDIFGSGSSGFKTIKEYIDLHEITHWKQIILPA